MSDPKATPQWQSALDYLNEERGLAMHVEADSYPHPTTGRTMKKFALFGSEEADTPIFETNDYSYTGKFLNHLAVLVERKIL